MNRIIMAFFLIAVPSVVGFSPLLAKAAPPVRDMVRDARGGAVVDARGGCVRTKWEAIDTGCDRIGEQETVDWRENALEKEARIIYFGFNQEQLDRDALERLQTLVHFVKQDRDIHSLKLVGHADRIGNPVYNRDLSLRRAERVAQYLKKETGLPTRVVSVVGKGDTTPVSDCNSKLSREALIACLYSDRRVQVELVWE